MGEEAHRPDHADAQLSHFPYPQQHHAYAHLPQQLLHHSNGAFGAPAATTNGEEEPYTIKCICGFLDDDGNTVLCEQCNTWQHIECYYFPTLVVPEIHKCNDCWPRTLDKSGAAQRQQRLRELQSAADDRRKRPAQKNSRRPKAKDLNQLATHTNGWSGADAYTADRKSGSPRDQQPPAKRPKTTHKPSASINANSHTRLPGHRNRSGSNFHSKSLPLKLPYSEYPPDYFSPDFIQIHRTNTDFAEAPANLYLAIGVSNLLSTWLDDPDAFAAATNGRTHEEVFKRFPQPIEELETAIKKNIHEDDTATFHGHHPIWPHLTVEKDLNEGDFVGELRGSIGHRDDYKADPVNRWEKLRHPDHFVFFHPHLPIYIDCRYEGCLLRYARRSCQPNLKLETIITGDRDYRFVFTALMDLPKGAEITVPWDTQYDRQLQDCLSRNQSSAPMNESEKAYVQEWVQTILAHFGGCACAKSPVCLMAHFDHRLGDVNPEVSARSAKNNKRKRANKRSPPNNPRAGNSRAGSEAVHGDQDADMDDDRSTSHSAPTGTSREGTPTARYLHDSSGTKGNELSERDKRKLMQQEKLFDKMEHDQGSRKKKRNSGSNVNTPAATGSKSMPARMPNSIPNTPGPAGKPRMVDTGVSYFSPVAARSPSEKSPQGESPSQTPAGKSSPVVATSPSRPEYVNAETQTEPEEDPAASQPPPTRTPHISVSQRLLRRSRLHLVQNAADGAALKADPSLQAGEVSQPEPTTDEPPEPSKPEEPPDVEMKDAESPIAEPLPQAAPQQQQQNSATGLKEPMPPTDQPVQPPPPSRPPEEAKTEPAPRLEQPRNNFRSTNLHVDLPPPPLPPSGSVNSPLASTPGVLSSVSDHSPGLAGPTAAAPALSVAAALSSVVRPSPVKKMSLSDYMNKRKTPAVEKSLGQSMHGSNLPSEAAMAVAKTAPDTEAAPRASPPTAPTLLDVKQEDPGEAKPA